MADVFTDGTTVYANLLAAGYDRYLEYQLRSTPIFRQLVDKHPVDETNVGPTVTLTLIQEFAALATTPLAETTDVFAVAPPAPVRVTVTVNEYGNVDLATLRLKELAFTAPDPAIAYVLGKNMVDTLDALVKAVLDGSTNFLLNAAGTWQTTGGAVNVTGAAASIFSSVGAIDAVALLRRRNASGRDAGDNYIAVIHPDVSVDVMSNAGWLAPHQYQDTENIYNAEVGRYLGARYVVSPRCTRATDGAASAAVYRSYFVGAQALVEATIDNNHIVVGPQIDRLRRFFPIGWYYHGGFSMFRQEAVERVMTWSSIAAL
jgi:N4-gp56 family major capsid protein